VTSEPNTNSLERGGASASSAVYQEERQIQGQPVGGSASLVSKSGKSTVEVRPATFLDHRAIRHMPDWIREIVCSVSEKHGVPPREVLSGSRVHAVVSARHEAIYLVKARKPHLSTTKLGQWFRRDHKTILYAIAKYQADHDAEAFTRFQLRVAA